MSIRTFRGPIVCSLEPFAMLWTHSTSMDARIVISTVCIVSAFVEVLVKGDFVALLILGAVAVGFLTNLRRALMKYTELIRRKRRSMLLDVPELSQTLTSFYGVMGQYHIPPGSSTWQ